MLKPKKMAMLARAMLDDFPELVSGYIVDAGIASCCLTGFAFKAFGYANGERFVSDEIMELIHYDSKRWLVRTRDNDCFVIVCFARGGRQSLMHLVDVFHTAHLAQSRWCLQ